MRPTQRPRAGRAWTVLDAAADVVACVVLITMAGLLLWSTAPLALGWRSSAVVSGSMAPQLRVGDVVVTSPVDGADVVPGQVVLFPDPGGVHRTLVHRVDSVDPEGRLVTRGDANDSADSTPLQRSAVQGLGRLRVPFVGLPRVWWQTGDLPRLAALTVLLTAATAVLLFPRPGRGDGDEGGDDEGDGEVPRTDVPGAAAARPTTRRWPQRAVAVGAAAALVPITTPAGAEAAFTRVTAAGSARSFTAGTVALSGSPSTALFSLTGLIPGDSGTACLTATYTGSLTAAVRLRAATGSSGSLAPHLQTTIQEGTLSGTAPDCTGFSATSTLFTGRLDAFLAKTSYAAGAGSWSPTAAGQTNSYRVTFQLYGANVARSASSTFALVVEAQGT